MKNGYQQFFKKTLEVAERENRQGGKAREGVRTSMKSPSQIRGRKPLAENLGGRLQERSQIAKKKTSALTLGVAAGGLMVTLLGAYKIDIIEIYIDNFLKKMEFSFIGSAVAEESAGGKPNGKEAPKTEDAQVAASGETPGKKNEITKKSPSDEEIDHFTKLNERKKELDSREEELNRIEKELAKQKIELDKKLEELENTRRQISGTLEERVKGDDKKINSLVEMYSNMKPPQAAKIFESMDEDLATEILGRMKKKPAAEILNLIKPEKAKVLSEKYAGYKRP